MSTREGDNSEVDIFHLLENASREKRRRNKQRLLESLGIEEFFEEGSISVDKKTCRGAECKLCIEACPTNALYWSLGDVGIEWDLCVYCTACVLSCIVDDCIRVWRRRPSGEVEEFSNPRQAIVLLHKIASMKRFDRVNSVPGWTRSTLSTT